MTTAQRIAGYFNNDGMNFKDEFGCYLDESCDDHGGRLEKDDSRSITYRYTFPDSSAIIIAGDCWDIGYSDCFCMQGNGHTEDCAQSK